MANRRLTRRQAHHVQRIQERRLARVKQRTQSNTDDSEANQLGSEEIGQVLANFGSSLMVENGQGEVIRCVPRANLELMVSGDRVVFQHINGSEGVVTALVPRRTELSRPDYGGRLKPLAANIDRLVVVAAVQPAFDEHLIDRYLAAAELLGAAPLVVVNKIDLADEGVRKTLHEQMSVYERIGYQVVYTSTRRKHGLDELFRALSGHTSILVGHSGTGKSSLIKALLPEQMIRIGDLSEASGQGRHTTTSTMLYHLPTGGDLIDSPGVREFRLYEKDPQRVAEGFIEFRPFLGHCRFRDCRHETEPGCALRDAVKQNRIDERRLASYRIIVREIASE